MSAERLRRSLAARGCEWPAPIEVFASLGSTNDHLRARSRSVPPWSVVLAESQSAGRGRRGRGWASPPGNLYLSVLLPAPASQDEACLVPLVAGLASAEALVEFSVQAQLKWPNDLLAGGRKLGGILAEGSWSGGVLDPIVLGLGVNVREDPALSDPALRGRATSIALLTGTAPDPWDVGSAILARLFARHAELVAGAAFALLAAWRARSVPWWGQLVEVVSVGQPERGRALDVDAGGALLLTRPDGSVARVLAGEARELRLAGGGTP